MVYGLWQSAAGLAAQGYRQAITANNLANADTPGFRPDRVAFLERLVAARDRPRSGTRHPVLDGMTGGLFETRVYTEHGMKGAAPIIPSENALDVAVIGDGFLAVRTPEGVRYTRDGRLLVDSDGALRQVASGAAVLDSAGQAIVVDRTRPVSIGRDGSVRQGETVAGKIAVIDFDDRMQLIKTGDNLLDGGSAGPRPGAGQIRAYGYEGSGVDPISTLVDMIAAARAYESNAKMITLQDESISRAVNQLGRLG